MGPSHRWRWRQVANGRGHHCCGERPSSSIKGGCCLIMGLLTCEMTMRREGMYLGTIEPSGEKLRERERGSNSASCTSLWPYWTLTCCESSSVVIRAGPGDAGSHLQRGGVGVASAFALTHTFDHDPLGRRTLHCHPGPRVVTTV